MTEPRLELVTPCPVCDDVHDKLRNCPGSGGGRRLINIDWQAAGIKFAHIVFGTGQPDRDYITEKDVENAQAIVDAALGLDNP